MFQIYKNIPIQFYLPKPYIFPILSNICRLIHYLFLDCLSLLLQQFFIEQKLTKSMHNLKKSEILRFSKGRLTTQEVSCQTQNSLVIEYQHIVRPSPEQYHTQAIKQYKKQLDEMRRNYYQLQKAYYLLLGYKWQGTEYSRLLTDSKGIDYAKFTVPSEKSNGLQSSMKKSTQVEHNDTIADMEDKRTKASFLTQSYILAQNENLSARPSFGPSVKTLKNNRTSLKTKTQTDEEIEIQLMNAMNQIQDLKFALQQAYITSQKEIQEFKESYEEHIRKLEEILERERKHTKMLNGVISRLRIEIEAKDNLIRSMMGLKSNEKGAIEKLMKQFKIKI